MIEFIYGISYVVGLCVSGGSGTYFYGDSYLITFWNYEVIGLVLPDRYFDSFNDGKLEVIVTEAQDCINAFICWCVYGWSGIDFHIDIYVIILRLDNIIDLIVSYRSLVVVMIQRLRVL